MDSFDKRIEDYKRELIKYAKKNSNVIIKNSEGFETARNDKKINEKKSTPKYNSQYVSNRPMPAEYLAEEDDISVTVNASAARDREQNAPISSNYRDFDDFIAKNPKKGKLRVQTYAANQVFPIQNARVLVEKKFDEGIYTFADIYTNIDGVAEEIILPTKNKLLSLTPGEAIPYETYTVTVTHPLFSKIIFHNVPIFESIESLQPVAMQPLSNPSVYEDVYEEAPRL